MSDTSNVKKEMDIIRKAMKDDPGFAYSWHCNIAMACYDSFGVETATGWVDHDTAHRIGNEAASRFMKLAFGIETRHLPPPKPDKNWADSPIDAEDHHIKPIGVVKIKR